MSSGWPPSPDSLLVIEVSTKETPGQSSMMITVAVMSWSLWFGGLRSGGVSLTEMPGPRVSVTVTGKEQPSPAVPLHLTVVVPTGKNSPEVGVQAGIPQALPEEG